MIFYKFILKSTFIIFCITFLTYCSKKNISTNITSVSEKTVWQYSNYFNGDALLNANKLSDNNFKIFPLGGSVTFPLISYPIIGNSFVVLMDKSGTIMKIDTESKNVQWKNIPSNTKNHFFSSYLNGGLSQNNDKVFATYGSESVLCVDLKTGKTIWEKKLNEIIRSYPVLHNGRIYLQTVNNGMYAINQKNGEVIWYKSGLIEQVNVVNVTSPIIYNKMIISQNSSGDLTGIDIDTGFTIWDLNTSDISDIYNDTSSNIIINQPILVGDDLYFYSSNKHVYKYSLKNKKLLWKSEQSISKPIYVYGKSLFAIDDFDNLIALNTSTGSKIWTLNINQYLDKKYKGQSIYWNYPTVINKEIYILSNKGNLYKFSLDGKFIKKENISVGNFLPIIYANDNAFVISRK
ncbi:MAG: outer membrane protein assembly factor BamB [Candidatus Midichloriaceae bacterium]|jgi:outer membrane protein assembly factor BamB